jgi:Ca2+/Na+ antiporter
MKLEKIFGVILTLFFMAFFALTKDFPALAGVLVCFSILVFLVCFEQIKKPQQINKGDDAKISLIEREIAKQNEAIVQIEDRLGRAELALGFKKANPAPDIK